MNGKGSNRRRASVSAAEYGENYDRIFGVKAPTMKLTDIPERYQGEDGQWREIDAHLAHLHALLRQHDDPLGAAFDEDYARKLRRRVCDAQRAKERAQ